MLSAPELAALVDRHTDTVLRIAAAWGRRFPWLADDFASDATYALFLAAQKHDPTKCEFYSFLVMKVRWVILTRLRNERLHNPAAFRHQPTATNDDGILLSPLDLLVSRFPDPTAALDQADDAEELDRLLARLPDRHRELLVRHIGAGEPVAALAAERGVSRSRINQTIRAAVAKLSGGSRDRDR
jgi:RNA polymerase sigma factor (sigma-70 family)